MGKTRKSPSKAGDAPPEAGLSFGSILEGLGKLIETVSEVAEKGQAVSRRGTFSIPGRREARGVYGFTVRTLAGSKPVIRRFGNFKETPEGPVLDETREPMVDVFEEGERLRVVAELAGCDEKDIRTEIQAGKLVISADTAGRKYRGEAALPCPVDEASLRTSYRNGVLEIELRRKP